MGAGTAATPSSTTGYRALGRPPRPFEDFVAAVAAAGAWGSR